jgi:MFS family permease
MRSLPVVATFAAYLPAAVAAPVADALSGGEPGAYVVAFCAAFALAFPLWGRWADRGPEQRVLATALAGVAATGVLLAVAPDEGWAIAARALEGATAAGVPPTAQAILARRGGARGSGRHIGGMMMAVAYATLGGPLVAHAIADAAGWRTSIVAICALPAAIAALLAHRAEQRPPAPTAAMPTRRSDEHPSNDPGPPAIAALSAEGPLSETSVPASADPAPAAAPAPRLSPTPGLVAGWAVAALVLSAYWTVLTRLGTILGGGGLHAADGVAAFEPLAGALGIPLVVLAARAADRRGPRWPMTATMAGGAVALGLAALAPSALVFLPAAGVALALYWAYLPVVAVQVQRCAPADARARAAAILYSSMWGGAAVGGLAATAAPSWRAVLAGAAIAWSLAGIVAWRGFLPRPAAP